MGDMKLRKMIENEVNDLFSGEAFATDPWDASIEDVAAAWQVLDAVKDRCEEKLKVLRERLMEEAEQTGVHTHKQGYVLKLDDGVVVTRERREGKLPKDEDLKDLLAKKKVAVDKAFTKKSVWVLDPSKLGTLVEVGKIKQKDVDAILPVSWALKVKPSPYLDALLAGFRPPEEELLEEEVDPRPIRSKRQSSAGARKGK